MNNIERFREYVSKVMQPGQRNRYLKGCANKAKYYEVDEFEALSIIRAYWGSDFKQTDENSFKNAYKTTKVPTTFSEATQSCKSLADYVRSFKKNDNETNQIQAEADREIAFTQYLKNLSKEIDLKKWANDNIKHYDKTSKFMLKLFDKNDIVWASNKCEIVSIEHEMKDMFEWSNRNESLEIYNFFAINPFKSLNSTRSDSEIKSFKYILFEADYLGIKDQIYLWIDLINKGLPIKSIIFTGNKSLHCLIKCPEYINSLAQYRNYVVEIFNMLNYLKKDLIDESCKNPSRLSRIPFGIRTDDKVLVSEEQKLFYLQENDDLLKNDAKDIIKSWVNSIYSEKNDSSSENSKNEVDEDEIIAMLKDRDIIRDIWDDGKYYHTLMRITEYDSNGNIHYSFTDKKWESTRSFYNFIQQTLKDQYHIKFDIEEIKNLTVKWKNNIKVPYVGNILPIKKDFVNTFIPGWLYNALNDKSIPNELNEPLKLFLDNIFGVDEKTKNWTLQWMREFMHTFNVITAPVFWEIPGTGKTMLAKAFGEAIGDWIKTPPKKDDIQFNAWQDHTVIIFEESSSGSKRDGKDLGDLLKDWITETEKTIESKGKDPIKKTIKSCFIFNANISEQVAPVFIEDNDRRYTIIRNDSAKNLRDIWNDEDYKRWDSGEYQKILMKWIYNLPKDNSIDIRKGIDNEYKKQVVRLGKNNIELALEEIANSYNGFISNADLMTMIYTNYGIRTTARANGNILAKLGYVTKAKCIRQDDGKYLTVRGHEFSAKIPENLEKSEESEKLNDTIIGVDIDTLLNDIK